MGGLQGVFGTPSALFVRPCSLDKRSPLGRYGFEKGHLTRRKETRPPVRNANGTQDAVLQPYGNCQDGTLTLFFPGRNVRKGRKERLPIREEHRALFLHGDCQWRTHRNGRRLPDRLFFTVDTLHAEGFQQGAVFGKQSHSSKVRSQDRKRMPEHRFGNGFDRPGRTESLPQRLQTQEVVQGLKLL